MGRHALMYRNQHQRWLARKIASRQPLVAYIARHQRLLHELMPTAGTSERMGILPERSFNWAGQRALPLARPLFRQLLEGEVEEERVFSSMLDHLVERQDEESSGQEVTFAPETEDAEDHTAIDSPAIADKPVEVADQQVMSMGQLQESQGMEPLEMQGQDYSPEQQVAEGAASSDPVPEVPSIQREDAEQLPGFNEPVEAKLQQEQKIVDERAQPIENAKTRHSRGRIQEQPVEPGKTSPAQAAPPSPPSRMARRKEQEAVSKEASEADDLFAPRDTDRSPQAWMARLMGARSVPHNDMAAPSTTVETEPAGVQTRSVTGVQPERREQPTDRDQFIPPVRQSSFAPVNEGPAAVTPQTDQSRRLNVGSQRLSAARANVARDSSEARPVPTPISQRARRFLQPLVGIDPASVRVYQDAQAEQLADAYQADAITAGDDVAMAAGHLDDTPETLGLLAHELTHVVRLREPHFIPPVVRARSSSPSDITNTPDTGVPEQPSVPSDEEALARRVESRVTRAARQQVGQAALPSIALASVEPPAGNKSSTLAARTAPDTWGGLPAPWEPLPDWLVSKPITIEDSGHLAAAPSQPSQAAYGTTSMQGSAWNGSTPGDRGVQRAGVERSLGEDEVREEQPPPDITQALQPDLDELARQVYSHLKRRLEVERRRGS